MSVQWIKLQTGIFENRKIRHLRHLPKGDTIVLIYLMLLTIAGRCNAGGAIFFSEDIAYTPKLLSEELSVPEKVLLQALAALEEMRMLSCTADGGITLCGWDEHQNADGLDRIREQNRLRKQNQRAREANEKVAPDDDTSADNENASRNMSRDMSRDTKTSVTLCHALEIEKEKEKNKTQRERGERSSLKDTRKQSVTGNVTECVTDTVTACVTSNVTDSVTERVTNSVTGDVTNPVTNCVTGSVTSCVTTTGTEWAQAPHTPTKDERGKLPTKETSPVTCTVTPVTGKRSATNVTSSMPTVTEAPRAQAPHTPTQEEEDVPDFLKKTDPKDYWTAEAAEEWRRHQATFCPPTEEEVAAYCRERRNNVDAARFVDYYAARGWALSKGAPMKDWRATVRSWEGTQHAAPAGGYGNSGAGGQGAYRRERQVSEQMYDQRTYKNSDWAMDELMAEYMATPEGRAILAGEATVC